MNKNIITSILAFAVSLTIAIVNAINTDFDFNLRAALILLSSVSSSLWLISSIEQSIDLKYKEELLKVIAYSNMPTDVTFEKLFPKISKYSQNLFKATKMGTSRIIYKREVILKLSFLDINDKMIGCVFLNQEQIILLATNFNKHKKDVFVRSITDCNERVEHINLIAKFIYENFRFNDDSENQSKTVYKLDENGNYIGNGASFERIEMEKIFNALPLIRDYLIMEKLNLGVSNDINIKSPE